MMKADDLRDYLSRRSVKFSEEKIPYGVLFRCPAGEMFTVYAKGKFTAQGAQTALTEEVRSWETAGCPIDGTAVRNASHSSAKVDPPVFIVYGHDRTSRDTIELLVRRMGLEPVILQNLPAAGDTIIEKLEHYLREHGRVGFACVLLTPDDEGHRAGFSEEKKYRARQNVVLELGMVLLSLGRPRVAILHKQSVELPSDIAGLIYIPFKETPEEVKGKLFQELRNAGYNPKPDAL
jgi:predicted nucleotide-binding protein